MSYFFDLDEDEEKELKEIEEAFERGEIKGLPPAELEKERKRLQKIARNTMNKTRNINIRLTQRDLHNLKLRALEEGIPYQTLAASILHKAASK